MPCDGRIQDSHVLLMFHFCTLFSNVSGVILNIRSKICFLLAWSSIKARSRLVAFYGKCLVKDMERR
jgi:hypothetical protein